MNRICYQLAFIPSLLQKKVIFLAKILLFFCLFVSPSFASCTLKAFVYRVLDSNAGLHAAESNVIAAKARHRANFFPIYNPELTGEYENAVENTRSVGINQTFDWRGKRYARSKLGLANLFVAEAEVCVLRQNLIAATLDALVKYTVTKKVLALAVKRSNALRKLVNVARKRYRNGDISRVELDLAKLSLSEGLAQEAGAQVSFNESLQTLRYLTTCTGAYWPSMPTKLPSLYVANISVEEMSAHAPAVQVLHQEYIAAKAKICVADRDRYPDPTFGIQGGYQEESGDRKNLFGLTLTLPLYILNPYRAEVDAANFDAISAAQKRADLFRQTRAEIMGSAERYQALLLSLRKWKETSRNPLSDGLGLVERLWRTSEITTTDYVFQLKQRLDSEIAGVELQGRAWEAWIAWLRVTGQAEAWVNSC